MTTANGYTASGASPLEKVLAAAERLAPARRSGSGYSTLCPAHNDKDPSLSISEGRNGNVVIYCHAGCEVEDVVTAFDLAMTDLFVESKRTVSVMASPPMRHVETYEYVDERWFPIYEIRRFEPKTFRPYLPNAERPGLNGVRHVLYRLPMMIERAKLGNDIVIVEGEKDVHAMEEKGYFATTNSGGSSGWLDELADPLIGASFVGVIADNDDAGRKWAKLVSDSLKVRAIDHKVYQVPGEVGADITDHFAEGLDLKDLPLLDMDASVLNEESENPFARSLINWPALFSSDRINHDWFCEPILAQGRGHAIYAEAKGGKSFFALPMACHVATGQAWLAMPEQEPRSVLYVDYEMSEADLWERIQKFGFNQESDLSRLHYCLLPSSDGLDTKRGGEELLEMAMDLSVELVVIDTMSRAVEGEENSADTLRNYYKHTGAKLKSHGITVQRLDHTGKDKSRGMRGTSAKADDVDVASCIKRSGVDMVEIVNTHSRIGWMPARTQIMVDEDPQGIMRHRLRLCGEYYAVSEATQSDAALLIQLGCKSDYTNTKVRDLLTDTGEVMSKARSEEALRFIKRPS